MKDINAEIKYDWKYTWEGVSEEKPEVNLLLKAIIEHDIGQLEDLYKQGATLEKCNKTTLQRILYEVMDDYKMIEWLVKKLHGGSAFRHLDMYGDYQPEHTMWGHMTYLICCVHMDMQTLIGMKKGGIKKMWISILYIEMMKKV